MFKALQRTSSIAFGLLVTIVLLAVPQVAQAQATLAGQLFISEFRLRGPNGANDEFIEIYANPNLWLQRPCRLGNIRYRVWHSSLRRSDAMHNPEWHHVYPWPQLFVRELSRVFAGLLSFKRNHDCHRRRDLHRGDSGQRGNRDIQQQHWRRQLFTS